MKADKWLEVNLVGLVILGGLTFVTTKIMNLAATVTQLQANVAVTSDRVDHLALALPGIAARVAQEQISRPLRTLVLVSEPARAGNQYRVNVRIIDVRVAQEWNAALTLAGPQESARLSELAWTGYQLDDGFESFARMTTFARTAGFDPSLPPGLDAEHSFVLAGTSAHDYLTAISRLGLALKAAPFAAKLVNWKDLTQALKVHRQDFE